VNSGAGGFDSHALPPPDPAAALRFRSRLSPRSSATLHPASDPSIDGPALEASAVEVRELREEDGEAVLRSFNRVSGAVDPGFRPRGLDAWRWRYFANPAGTRAALALDAEGRVLAHFGGSPQELRVGGASLRATQGIDSFSLPEARRLGRRGLFVRVARHLAAMRGGRGAQRDPWFWGFPVPAARRIGVRALGYEALRAQPVLVLRSGSAPPAGVQAEALEGAWLPELAGPLDELCTRLEDGSRVLADRRAPVLAWRYLDAPHAAYRLAAARTRSGELHGLAVWRPASFEGRPAALVAELLAVEGAEAPLTRWLVAGARAAGLERLVHLCSPYSTAFASLQELGWRVEASSRLLVGRSFDRELPPRFWSERWDYSLGDTDLV